VKLPDAWTERLPFLEPLEEDWTPMPRAAWIAWLLFYLFFLYELVSDGIFPGLMNGVFVPVHEGGHLLFRFFGEFIAVAGGTFLQLFAPFALAVYFAFQRQAQGVAFCLFFMFDQLLPTATYMADARAQELPLLTVGDAEYVIHDWNYLFGAIGMLDHDIQIAGVVRAIGWIGMIGVCVWLLWHGWNDVPDPQSARERPEFPPI
jgi:phosphotransferase system  glucose/maltose/N-acetylglucosamine-specific IIC component